MARLRQPLEDQFTDDQKKEIIDDYENGMTQEEIGKKFGLPRRSVMKLLKRLGIETRNNIEAQKSRFDTDFVDKVKELRTKGNTLQQIADLTNRSTSAVARVCQKFKIDEAPKINVDEKLVCDDYQFMSLNKLSDKFNISSHVVKQILLKNNIKIRDPVMSGGRTIKISEIVLPHFEDTYDWWKDAYDAYGMSSIAKFLGRSIGFVSHKLKNYCIDIKTISDRQTEFDKDELVKAYKHHGSMSKVAKRFNCTITTVSNALSAHEIIPTTASEMFCGEGNHFYGKEHSKDIKEYCKEIGTKSGKQFWIDHPEYVEVVKEKQRKYWSDITKRYEANYDLQNN